MGKTSTERSRDRRARLAGFKDYDDMLEDKRLHEISAEMNAGHVSDRQREIILERDRQARIERAEATSKGLLALGCTPECPDAPDTIEFELAGAIYWHRLLKLGPVPPGRTLKEEIDIQIEAFILCGSRLWNPLSNEWSKSWTFDVKRRNRDKDWYWLPESYTLILNPKDFEYKSAAESRAEALAQ